MKAIYENKEPFGLRAVKAKGIWAFPEMFHPHCEIVMITKGEAKVSVEGNRRVLTEGELCFVFPYCIHSYEEAPDAEACILLFDTAYAGGFERFLYSHTPKLPYRYAPELYPLLERICRLCQNRDPLFLQTAEAYLQALTGELLQQLDCTAGKSPVMDVARQALSYCAEHYGEEGLSLATVASALYVSPGYLSKLFKCKLKTPFRQYLNELRLSKAKLLLTRTAGSVVEVMLESGFSNQSTFNRVFLARYGLTPKEYRKRFAVDQKPTV